MKDTVIDAIFGFLVAYIIMRIVLTVLDDRHNDTPTLFVLVPVEGIKPAPGGKDVN